MAANHLEQLVAEWYEYQGYFVRRNIKVGRRAKGGYEGELDIVALHPERRHLVHIETSLDALPWATRDQKFRRKFDAGTKYIPGLFTGIDMPAEIDSVAILVFASNRNRASLGGGRLMIASELYEEIIRTLAHTSIRTGMIDEQKPLLRTLQFVAEYRSEVVRALSAAAGAGP
jgi:hypothetical protein